MSIIDSLAEGFRLVTRKLWLAVIPMALDILFWLGPKVSVAPVVDRMVATFRQTQEAIQAAGGQDMGMSQTVDMTIQLLQGTVSRFNLLALLAWGRLGLPTLTGAQPIDPARDRVLEIAGYGQMLVAQILLMAVGLIIACLFLGLIGQQVRGEQTNLGHVAQRLPAYWLYMLAVFVPFGIMLMVGSTIGFLLGPLSVLVLLFFLWLLLFLSFVPSAITVDEVRPLGALWNSFAVVRLNFWSALGLLVLINAIITPGLGLIWQRLLGGSSVGTVIAILANAYVGTGLAAAVLTFYHDRVKRWHQAIQQQRSGVNHV